MCLCALALGHGAGTPFTLSLLGSVTSDGTSLSCPPVHRMGTPPHPPPKPITGQATVKPVPMPFLP